MPKFRQAGNEISLPGVQSLAVNADTTLTLTAATCDTINSLTQLAGIIR